jgi:hypothetical protein
MCAFKKFLRQISGSAMDRFAVTAGGAALCAVIAAEVLASLGQRGDLPKVTLVWPDAEEQRLARAAPSPQPGAGRAVYRAVGVDGVTTASIPRTNPGSLRVIEPCGEQNK